MSEEAALHIVIGDNLAPHEADSIDLVFLYAPTDLFMHENISLVVKFPVVDDDLTVICIKRMARFYQRSLEFLSALLLFC